MRLLTARVTYLVMHQRPAQRLPAPACQWKLALVEVPGIPLSYYRYLYDTVGRAHHWTSRHLPDAQLKREIHADNVRIGVLYADGAPAGWFELNTRQAPGEARIVHFGMMPDYRGQGLARFMLSQAIHAGFDQNPALLSIETNTLDHKAALPLYQKMGFQPVSARDVLTPAIED